VTVPPTFVEGWTTAFVAALKPAVVGVDDVDDPPHAASPSAAIEAIAPSQRDLRLLMRFAPPVVVM
jgi:hypothetical protein